MELLYWRENELSFRVHLKPGQNIKYLNRGSAHPSATFKALLQCESKYCYDGLGFRGERQVLVVPTLMRMNVPVGLVCQMCVHLYQLRLLPQVSGLESEVG